MEERQWCRQCGRYARPGHEKQARFAPFHDVSETWEQALELLAVPA